MHYVKITGSMLVLQVKLWNLPTKRCYFSAIAHDGVVRGATFHPDGSSFFSVGLLLYNNFICSTLLCSLPLHVYIAKCMFGVQCGSDKAIKKWNAVDFSDEPMMTILGEVFVMGYTNTVLS